MKRLQLIDRESIWFHESFAIDPWSTARQLLEWRDELLEAGWDGQAFPSGSLRLDALAELECSDVPLSGGRSDQLRRATTCLKCGIPAHIESIILTEPSSMLPPAWRHVFELLKSQGTNITCLSMPDRRPKDGNLSRIQAVIGGIDVQGTLSPDDDTIILLKADNEWEAAEHLALWLASKNEANDQVTIICGMDTSVLDQALKRHGLPRLSRTAPSRWREIQQILSLTLANAWRPVDIRLVVELLSLTLSVFPKWVCKIILKAVAEEPGIGGRAWNHAIIKISEKYKDFLAEKDDPESEEKAEALIRSIQSILVNDRFDSVEGIPEAKLRERCQVLIERLAWQAGDMPILTEVINQAREMQKLSLGKGFIPASRSSESIDRVIGLYAKRMEAAARRLELDGNGSDYQENGEWRSDVKRIVDLARSNQISPDGLKVFAVNSWKSLSALFGEPLTVDMDKDLLDAINRSIDDLNKPLKKLWRRLNHAVNVYRIIACCGVIGSFFQNSNQPRMAKTLLTLLRR